MISFIGLSWVQINPIIFFNYILWGLVYRILVFESDSIFIYFLMFELCSLSVSDSYQYRDELIKPQAVFNILAI